MGFFERIFGYKNSKVNNDDKSSIPSQAALNNENAARLLECGKIIGDILGSEKYVPRSEYVKIKDYSADVDFFDVLKNSSMLKEFAKRNKLSISSIEKIMESYWNIDKLVEDHNEAFISNTLVKEKDYLDNILKTVDDKIVLDEDQRRVVLTDEDYCLVIAGAGAGKTTTVEPVVRDEKGKAYSRFLILDKNNQPASAQHWQNRMKWALGKYNRSHKKQLPKITPHICRHTYCTKMARAGISPKALQYLMGHADVETTFNVYTHFKSEDARSELVRLNVVAE